jgi:hypothetical protein
MDLQKGKRRIFIFNFISLDHMPKLISITTDETDTLFVNKTTSYSAIHMVRDGPLENWWGGGAKPKKLFPEKN